MPSFIWWAIVSSSVLIAGSKWALFAFYAQRSSLNTEARQRLKIASGVYLVGWLLLACLLGSGGIFQAAPSRAFPALGLAIVLLILAGGRLLYRSSALKTVLAAISLPWLVGLQFYRVLGVNFLALYALGQLPGEFAIPAGWGDVAVGLAAPVVGYALYHGYRWSCLAALSWNVLGILDLVVAVVMGFLSSPGPFQMLALENPNMLITAFPLVLVPLYAVPLSILLHFAALKRLRGLLEAPSPDRFTCGARSRHLVSDPI